jgi:hypothetical protein
MQSMSGKTFMPVEHQAENRPKYADAVEENNKRYHENSSTDDRRLTSTFLAPLNANGVTIIPI